MTGSSRCSAHRIKEVVLKQLLLDDIKRHAELVRINEKQVLSTLREKLTGMYSQTGGFTTKDKRKLKRELHEIELRTETLYENKVSGIITAERFTELVGASEARRNEIQALLETAEQSANATNKKIADIERWVQLIKENSQITEIDRELLDALIDKIVVGEKVKEDGVTTQDVRIFYQYVGLV